MTWTTLQVIIVFFQSITDELEEPDDRFLSRIHTDSARISQRRLLEAFPELTEWLAGWTRGSA
jgi:hypothetical protein